jgi:hypothetical protein
MNSTFKHQINPSTADQVKGRGTDDYRNKNSKSRQIPENCSRNGTSENSKNMSTRVPTYEHPSTIECANGYYEYSTLMAKKH